VKQGLMLASEDGNCTYLNQLDVRNLLVASVSQIIEEQLLHDPFWDLTFSNQRSNAVYKIASCGLTV
jgi:hypothetical protein